MLRGLRHWHIEKVVLGALLALIAAPAPSGAASDAANSDPKSPPGEAAKPAAPQSAPAAGATPVGLTEQGPFEEKTTVQGKIDTNLQGVWLLVASPEVIVGKGKYRTFPQLLKITDGKDGLEFHLLDVQLPDSIAQAVDQANRKTMSPWVPSEDVRKALAKDWSTLPPAKQKNIMEFLYGKIDYELAAPDRYGDAFKQRSELINKVLEGSKFSMRIVEVYKPRELPPETRISQLIQRTTVYGAKATEKDVIKGDLTLGFLAAGGGFPLPFEFPGQFVMYRLAPL